MQEKQHYEAGNWISVSLNWPQFIELVEVKEDGSIYIRVIRWLLSPVFYYSSFVQQLMILYSFNCPWCPPGNNCSLPGSSVHEISQARILEWIAISFSRASVWPRDQTRVSFIADRFFIDWATRKALLIWLDSAIYKHSLNIYTNG